jgi:hypothetical protein
LLLVIVALLVVPLAADAQSAAGTRAWILWSESRAYAPDGKLLMTTWERQTAFDEYTRCAFVEVEIGRDPLAHPRDWYVARGYNASAEDGWLVLVAQNGATAKTRAKCFPDTVDPRK